MNEPESISLSDDVAKLILHPTDFSPASELAFAHALRLAITNKATLSILHVGEDADEEWDRFPSVRQTLQRWGFLEEGARRADLRKLGIGVEKLVATEGTVVDAIAGYLFERPVDLLVLATEGRRGPAAWLKRSTAVEAARRTQIPTLFVPARCHGCVSMETGQVTMKQVLIPVDHKPSADGAIERGLRAIQAFGDEESQLQLLHVGPGSDFPDLRVPDGPWRVARVHRDGNPVTEILAAAEESRANLLIMVTEGAEGYLDILRGTTTEQVLRRAPCPVLSVPADF